MKRNEYSKRIDKAVKLIAKQPTLIIEHTIDGAYYITNGHFLVIVPEDLYNAAFRIASPRFVEVASGTTVRADDTKKLPKECETTLINCPPKEEGKPCKVSPYTLNRDEGNARVLKRADGENVYLNDEWFTVLSVFNPDGEWFQSSRRSPVCGSAVHDTFIMICPIWVNDVNWTVSEVA